jgi:hypothetical protein
VPRCAAEADHRDRRERREGRVPMSSSNRELVEKGKRTLKRSLASAANPQEAIDKFRKTHEGSLGSKANEG